MTSDTHVTDSIIPLSILQLMLEILRYANERVIRLWEAYPRVWLSCHRTIQVTYKQVIIWIEKTTEVL